MAAPNRATLLTKAHKVLKKHYTPVVPDPDRPVLEQLLLAICLENATYAAAQAAFEALRTTFFDWNEVRVSTAKELAELVKMLPDPQAAATALKKTLQTVFESTYSFDLEFLRKQTLGQAMGRLEKLQGGSPFALACITQWALGGHAIPIDRSTLDVLFILGIITEANREAGMVPGAERAIPKNKGVEFSSLLHGLTADYAANPFSPNVHKILLEIAPDARPRLPKRGSKKPQAPEPSAPAQPAAKPSGKPSGTARPPASAAEKKAVPKSKPADLKKPASRGATSPIRRKEAASTVSKRKPR